MARKPQFGRIFRRKWKKPDGTAVELPIWWIEYYNGHQIRESSKSERYRDAERLLKTRNSEALSGSSVVRPVKVSELLDDLLRDYELNGKSIGWARDVDKMLRPFFGEMKVAAVNSAALDQYIDQRRVRGRANATINREISLLRRAYNLGARTSPPKVARVPRFPRLTENNVRKGFFEHSEFIKLRTALPEYLRPVITFAYFTGCRRGEILALKWQQVDLEQRVIRLEPGETKNEEGRILPLGGDLLQVLSMQKAIRDQKWPGCGWVFFRNGQQIHEIKEAWRKACIAVELADTAGKPIRLFHDLRRTGVRNLIRAGVPERVAMAISGHKTRAVFDRYNIVSERDLHEAALRLDGYLSRQEKADKDKSRTSGPLPENSSKRDSRKRLN